MPSNSEMYERGAFDAEQDELNPFYYQHYYYYRRGYDDVRRQLKRGGPAGGEGGYRRLLIGLGFGAAAALGLMLLYLSGLAGPPAAPTQAPAAAAATTPTPRPTATLRPLATAAPTPTPAPALAVGGRARVANLSGAPLRAREAAGLTRVVARIPEGSEVALLEGPVEADGYRWWRVEGGGGAGWVAERAPEGTVFLEPIP